jgi:PmbA protein
LNGVEMAAKTLEILRGQGADQAEVFFEQGDRLRIKVRQGKVEYLKKESFRGVGMRAYVGQSMAFVDTADLTEPSLGAMAKKAVELAGLTGDDPANGLPQEKGKVRSKEFIDKKLYAASLEEKTERLIETERLARDHHSSITLSNGASYSEVYRTVAVANTHGLSHTYDETRCSINVSVVAVKDGDKMEGWDTSHRRRYHLLRKPADMAATAGQMAVSLVGGKPVPSVEVPVVFDARAAGGLLGGLAGAVNGKAVHQGNSFLTGMLNKPVASKLITIMDDGLLLRGLGSSPVDGEGVATTRKVIVQDGVLQTFLYDTYGARKAGTRSTGNGIRGSHKDLPGIGVTNFYVVSGETPPEDLIKDIKQGLYIQDTIGFGANTTTGGYSTGAFGRWIEGGQLTVPVAQVTVAGNLVDIFSSIDAVGNDLEFNGRIACPSIRVAQMTVAGT